MFITKPKRIIARYYIHIQFTDANRDIGNLYNMHFCKNVVVGCICFHILHQICYQWFFEWSDSNEFSDRT